MLRDGVVERLGLVLLDGVYVFVLGLVYGLLLFDGVYVFLVGLVLEGLTLLGVFPLLSDRVLEAPLFLTIVVRVGVVVVRTVSPLVSVVVTVRVPVFPLLPLDTLVVGAVVLVRTPVFVVLPLLTSPVLPPEVVRAVIDEAPLLLEPVFNIRPPGPRLVCPPPPLTTSEPLRPL